MLQIRRMLQRTVGADQKVLSPQNPTNLCARLGDEAFDGDRLPWSREGRFPEALHEGVNHRHGDLAPLLHLVQDLGEAERSRQTPDSCQGHHGAGWSHHVPTLEKSPKQPRQLMMQKTSGRRTPRPEGWKRMEKGWSTSQPHDTTSMLSPVISSPIHHMRCAGNPRRCPLRGRNGSGISKEKKQLPAGGFSEPLAKDAAHAA